MIFEVQNTPTKIIGSIHHLPTSEPDLAPAYFSAVESADVVVFESDLTAQSIPSCAFYDSFRLPSVIKPKAFNELEKLWKELEIPFTVKNAKPWFAGLMLSIFSPLKSGTATPFGVDKQLWDHALQLGKPLQLLETREDLFSLIAQSLESESVPALKFTLSIVPEMDSRYLRLAKAWKDADFPTADSLFLETSRLTPTAYRAMFETRNKAWLPSILQSVDTNQSALFVVGFGHLKHGESSLEKLLQQHGHTIRRVL